MKNGVEKKGDTGWDNEEKMKEEKEEKKEKVENGGRFANFD